MKKSTTYTVIAKIEFPGIGTQLCRVRNPEDDSYVFVSRARAEAAMTAYLAAGAKVFESWDCQIVTNR